jgi:hypothetical protein
VCWEPRRNFPATATCAFDLALISRARLPSTWTPRSILEFQGYPQLMRMKFLNPPSEEK